MKRLLILLLLVLVVPVGATQLAFQNSADITDLTISNTNPGTSVTWVQSATGGNNYLDIYTPASYYGGNTVRLTLPEVTTYAAFTELKTGSATTCSDSNTPEYIALLDSTGGTLYGYRSSPYTTGTLDSRRWEIKMSGGQAYIYIDGTLVATSGALAQNPSYVSVGLYCPYLYNAQHLYIDDYVYGQGENKYIYDMPETGQYKIINDAFNPANSGLYTTSGSIVDSNNMPTRFGRGHAAIPPDALTNQSINLVQLGGVIPYATLYTSTDYSGARIFNIHEALINSTAPYGYYAITIPGSALYSDPILYESGGATVTWDKDVYSVGDTGVIVSYVASGGYWDPAVYDYQLDVQDIFGNVIKSQTVNTQSGSMSVTFTSNDNLGVYYAILKAKLKSSATYDIWMSVDAAELQAYIVFTGYPMDAETGAIISDATINVTQGTATKNSISGSYGWNSTNNWLSGSQFNITTNKTGYASDVKLFTPLTSKSIALNISLVPDPATRIGTSVGGLCLDNVYGNPIVSATRHVMNGTEYQSTTNIAGFGRSDNLPVPNTWYDVWCSKTGYKNSSVVPVFAVAA
jgi:hypothetical protein